MYGNMNGDQSCDWAKHTTRLRKRSRRACYLEEEVMEGMTSVKYSYDILDKIRDTRFLCNDEMVLQYENGNNFNVQCLQTDGFNNPIIFHSPIGLDMKIPPYSFNVSDVKNLIGPSRMIDVMDCSSQEALNMRLDQFCKYYDDHELHKDKRLLNVISLEFSHTRLDPYIEAPRVVRELDWVSLVWPKDLIALQTDSTNILKKMMYPKVQKYCLMSVAGCYTDFHLDFGGTSVWYHILKGEKIFFLIPPSKTSYSRFEDWQKHGQQEKTFFPDLVEKCTLVHLKEGDTLLLPSGWIHGVYTPKQSLVFGGNFLHSFHITGQLEVSVMEKTLKVHDKFCYPFYSQMHWYVIERYVQCFTVLAKLKEKRTNQHTDTDCSSYPPGKWVESVNIQKCPIDKFRFRPSADTGSLSPYMSPMERDGLNYLIAKMKAGLFLSDKPDRIGNAHTVLAFLETQLQCVRTLCSHDPNGITLLGMSCDSNYGDNKRTEVTKQSDSEVINIIEEFFGAGVKDGSNWHSIGQGVSPMTVGQGVSPMTVGQGVSPMTVGQGVSTMTVGQGVSPMTVGQGVSPMTVGQGVSPMTVGQGVSTITTVSPPLINPKPISENNGHVIDHTHQEHVSSKLIEELMQNTFGDKSLTTNNITTGQEVSPLTMLSEFSTDQVIQFLTSGQKTIAQTTNQMTPTSNNMTPISNHMTPNSDHMTPTTNIPGISNLTPDNMTNLLDQVNSLLVLPGLSKVTNEDDSLSKIGSSSLDLLSPMSSSPFSSVFTATPTSLATPPNSISLTNQIGRNLLSSCNSETSLFHSVSTPSSSYHPSLLRDSHTKPTSLPLTPITSKGTIPLVKPMVDSDTKSDPSSKEVKRRYSKQGGRKSRSNSKTSAKKPASRKSRCGKCDGCKRSPCGECKFCLDSVRMGGFGKLKKACIQRRCSNMVEPRTPSISLESPSELLHNRTDSVLSLSKKALVKTIKTEGIGHASMTMTTPTLDSNPMIEVLSMGYAGNNEGNMETSGGGVLLHPETFGLTDDLNGGRSLITVSSSNSRESPLMRLNDTYSHEDPLFNTIPTIHAHILSSPASSQLSAIDLFPFSTHSSMSESDFTLHLSEDNV